MLIGKLEDVKDKFGYFFHEGDEFQQNLNEFEDDTDLQFIDKLKVMLLYDYNEAEEKNDFGALIKTTYDCLIFFAVRSSFTQPGGLYRYNKYTKDCRQEFKKVEAEFNLCNAWEFKINKVNKKLNQLDTNLDGIMISCNIEYNHNYDSLL